MTRKILAVSLAVLFAVSMIFVGYTDNVQAHTIPDKKVDKEFILCAVDTTEQSVHPMNDLRSLGIENTNSWTFVLLDENDAIVEADAGDFAGSEFEDLSDLDAHGAVNGQPHSEINEDEEEVLAKHYKCDFADGKLISAPGPAISVDLGDTVRITLVSDIGNEHVHSIDQHAVNGDEHVNSGPIHIGHQKSWIWKAEDSGSYLYHCAGNGLVNVWTHINNGMYGNIIVQPKDNKQGDDDDDDRKNKNTPAAEYSVMFADMYLSGVEVDGGSGAFGMETMASFLADDKILEVTNGQAFNYAPAIGAEWDDGDHSPIILNPLENVMDPLDLETLVADGAPILAPTNELTRWYITNPGPNEFLAWHFIAGQIDVRDGSTPKKLMTPVANEETWTVPPGSSSITDSVFPSNGLYIGVTHKLNDVVKGGAFAVLACDTDTSDGDDDLNLPTILGTVDLEFVCNNDWDSDGTGGTLDDLKAFNGLINPKTVVNEI